MINQVLVAGGRTKRDGQSEAETNRLLGYMWGSVSKLAGLQPVKTLQGGFHVIPSSGTKTGIAMRVRNIRQYSPLGALDHEGARRCGISANMS